MKVVMERFDPKKIAPPWIRHQHLARYEWAVSFVPGKRVLDVACGLGYGSQILSLSGARAVSGVDGCPHTIERGRHEYPGSEHSPVEYLCSHAGQLPYDDGTFEVVVSFETIEHLEDDSNFTKEICRVLQPGGVFICSSPNRTLLNPGSSRDDAPFNEHHVREYSKTEFVSLLRENFNIIAVYGQSGYSLTYLTLLERVSRFVGTFGVRAHQLRKVLEIPFRSSTFYEPSQLVDDNVYEIHIVVCEKQ